MAKKINLATLFKRVTQTLTENQTSLNEADSYNHDHGDNMVQIFEVITQAMKAKKGADPADQLAYASQLLRERAKSGSAGIYADGLAQASRQFQGKQLTPETAPLLVQALLGGSQPSTAPSPTAGAGDMLGSLLGGMGGAQGAAGQPGLDVGDLLTAGMSFMQAKQAGSSDVDALVKALVSGSQVGQEAHRAQSGTLVANTLLQLMGSLGSR
jgi:hypothetical protein